MKNTLLQLHFLSYAFKTFKIKNYVKVFCFFLNTWTIPIENLNTEPEDKPRRENF